MIPLDENGYRRHLQRQLRFLENSCASFDTGHSDEAIRVAVVARVLVHDTARSTSLLAHLGRTDIRLLSTTRGLPVGKTPVFFDGITTTRASEAGVTVLPKLENGSCADQLPVSDWWSQAVVMVDGVTATRKHLVLAAANKDGGAHVDATLTPEYELLAADGSLGHLESVDRVVAEPIKEAHLMALRQIGYELLHSPELLALAESG
jgi:hypothetical protein